MTWFDSHCHLDASEFSEDIDQVVERAVQVGLKGLLIVLGREKVKSSLKR